ncbi:threonine/serine exporter family protein [Ferroacidibacillus organovorans]|uniref:Threonine/serine exporter-like N-terminal domain-containing protein n=1 Tax=Ferroacidibacillus organovorans TaxID=1765683 RepID=A0A101XRX1_9BACL|nr:threonine/serine exporter family protein [Ferroacidibacillus organovorans]KUO96413.1 hypothetical protein ATW55_00770 [Ferroacidibacillus organovorans]
MDEHALLDLLIQASRLLLSCGGETSRVEKMIDHLARGAGLSDDQVQSFVTPTGIFISVTTENGTTTRLCRMREPGQMDLGRVTAINDLSRRFASGSCTLDDAIGALKRIEAAPARYSRGMQLLAAMISSGSFAVVLGGTLIDFVVAAVAGLTAQSTVSWLNRFVPRFFGVLLAALIASLLAEGFGVLVHSTSQGAITIGAILPLLPGLAITNAIRDLLAGDLLAGVARGAEGLFTAVALAVAVTLSIGVFAHFL